MSYPGTSQISRRCFLKSIAVLGLSSCVPFTSRTKFIHLLTNDPHPDQYTPVLISLIKTILPFDHPEFPNIDDKTVLKNIIKHFPFTDENLEPFQRAFMVFNEIGLFPQKLPAIIDEETKHLIEFERLETTQIKNKMTEFLKQDEDLFFTFQKEFGSHDSFQSAPKEVQAGYFSLWAKSSFSIRRMFYNSAKGVINACAYCHDKMWDAIRYEGHFNPPSKQ